MLKAINVSQALPVGVEHQLPAGRRILIILLSANFASAAAAAMVNIFIASYVKQVTGAALWAAAAIVVAYLPPLFVGSYLGGLIDRRLQRNGILLAELGSAALTVCCGIALFTQAPLVLLLGMLGVRSLLVAGVRNSLTRWLKLDAPATLQESRMQLFILTILLGLPASGLAMGWASTTAAPVAISISCIALVFHAISFCALTRLPAKPQKIPEQSAKNTPVGTLIVKGEGLIGTLREIFSNRALAMLFTARIFAQPVFQAAEQILVSVRGSELGAAGMAKMQTVGGLGLLAGFFLSRVFKPSAISNGGTMLVIAVGLACMLTAAHPNTSAFMLPAFFGMTVIYEVIYVYSVSRFFKHAPQEAVARYSIISTHIGGTLMSLSAMIFGLSIDQVGLGFGTILFVSGAIAYGLLLLWFVNRSSVAS